MRAQRSGCCQRTKKRRGWATGGLLFAGLTVLMPKCPMCIAAWFGVLGLSGLAMRVDARVLFVAVALAVAIVAGKLVHRFAGGIRS